MNSKFLFAAGMLLLSTGLAADEDPMAFQLCLASQLSSAHNQDGVKALCVQCASSADAGLAEIENCSNVQTGWCRQQANYCSNPALGCNSLPECPVPRHPTHAKTAPAPKATADSVQAQASADIARCQTSEAQANNCCLFPQTCGAPAPQASSGNAGAQGLAGYCQQLQAASAANSTANSQAAQVCSFKYESCNMACTTQLVKYQNLADSCAGCSAQAVYDDAVTQLTTTSNACDGLQARIQALGAQQIVSAEASGQAAQCGQQASAMQPRSADAPSVAAVPVQVAANDALNTPRAKTSEVPTAHFPASAKAAGDFDVSDTSDGLTKQTHFDKYEPRAAKVTPVANNTGGAIPGSASSSGTPSSPGRPAAGGVNTDILQGQRSGGYSQVSSADVSGFSLAGGHAPVRWARDPSGNLDLKAYLPGGAMARSAASMVDVGHGQVMGRFDDIWAHITNRMNEKCRLGHLYDCR